MERQTHPPALPAIRPRSTSVPPAEEAERRGQPWTPPQPLLQLRSLGGPLLASAPRPSSPSPSPAADRARAGGHGLGSSSGAGAPPPRLSPTGVPSPCRTRPAPPPPRTLLVATVAHEMHSRREGMYFYISSLLGRKFASPAASAVGAPLVEAQWRARGKIAFASRCWTQSESVLGPTVCAPRTE